MDLFGSLVLNAVVVLIDLAEKWDEDQGVPVNQSATQMSNLEF